MKIRKRAKTIQIRTAVQAGRLSKGVCDMAANICNRPDAHPESTACRIANSSDCNDYGVVALIALQ